MFIIGYVRIGQIFYYFLFWDGEGNSLGRGLKIGGVEVVSKGGAKLGELMDAVERERLRGVDIGD